MRDREGTNPELFADGTAPTRLDEGALHLVFLAADPPASFELPESGVVVIGRAAGCDVRIDQPSVSRRHASLHLGPRLFLTDLGSANGITLRGKQLVPGALEPLGLGEPFELGGVLVVVHRRPVVRAPTMPPPALITPPREPAIAQLMSLLDRVARSDIAVLLRGETGVGKEVFAERIHRASARASQPFVRVNCAAIAASVAESELFGHERGAFTGAAQPKRGLVEAAHGGTLFLDEVGDMPAALQVGLLRVLEHREVLPVGSVRPRPVDVRFVAATNRDLEYDIEAGVFRRDLYYRLNGITLEIPPLRERRSEIRPLAAQFLRDAAHRARLPVPAVSPAALALLDRYDWPGNVRELRNAMERALVVSGGEMIDVVHLPREAAQERSVVSIPPPPPTHPRPPLGDDDERARIEDALARCGGNQSRAAELLGMSRRTLLKRLDQYGFPRPLKR